MIHDEGFCLFVHVESPFGWDFVFDDLRGITAIEIGVFGGDFVKDEFSVGTFGSFGVEGIAFDDEKGVVIKD